MRYFSEGVSAETIATPLYPPPDMGLIGLQYKTFRSDGYCTCGLNFDVKLWLVRNLGFVVDVLRVSLGVTCAGW